MLLSAHRSSSSTTHPAPEIPSVGPSRRPESDESDESDVTRPETIAESPTSVDPRFAEHRRTGDRAIRNALVEDHRWLGQFCARRFVRKGVPTEDLVQVAMLGLVKAVDRFDPGFGYSFTTFAVPTITGELRRHFRDSTWTVRVSRRAQENYLRIRGAAEELAQTFGRSPTVPELGDRTGLDPDEIIEALDLVEHRPCASLDANADEDEGDREDQMCLAVDETGYATCEARLIAPQLLALLPTDRDRRIIQMRFVDGMSQSRIAAELGLSQVHISRLLRANLDLMREHLA